MTEQVVNGRFIKVRYELLGIIVMIVIQSFGAVWWAARTEQRLANLEASDARSTEAVEDVHTTQVQILQELARLRQAIEDADCVVRGMGTGGGLDGPPGPANLLLLSGWTHEGNPIPALKELDGVFVFPDSPVLRVLLPADCVLPPLPDSWRRVDDLLPSCHVGAM